MRSTLLRLSFIWQCNGERVVPNYGKSGSGTGHDILEHMSIIKDQSHERSFDEMSVSFSPNTYIASTAPFSSGWPSQYVRLTMG